MAKRYTQPQSSAQIDWSNLITRGLTYCFKGTPEGMDVVVGTKPIVIGNSIRTGFGGALGAGANDSLKTSLTTHATQRTYVFASSLNGNGGGNFGRVFDKRVSGAQTEVCYLQQGTPPVLTYQRVWSGGNQGFTNASATGATNSDIKVAVTVDTSSSSNAPALYVNGEFVSNGAGTTGTLVNNSDAYVLGNRLSDSARGLDGTIGYFFVFDRILTPSEIKSLYANPWQIFAAPSRVLRGSATSVAVVQPSSDVSAGAWTPSTGVTLFGCVDETPYSDTDYISTSSASTCEMAFPAFTFPVTAGVTLSYRAASVDGSTLTVSLKQSGSTVASWAHTLTSTVTQYSDTMTAPQIATITDPAVSPISITFVSS